MSDRSDTSGTDIVREITASPRVDQVPCTVAGLTAEELLERSERHKARVREGVGDSIEPFGCDGWR